MSKTNPILTESYSVEDIKDFAHKLSSKDTGVKVNDFLNAYAKCLGFSNWASFKAFASKKNSVSSVFVRLHFEGGESTYLKISSSDIRAFKETAQETLEKSGVVEVACSLTSQKMDRARLEFGSGRLLFCTAVYRAKEVTAPILFDFGFLESLFDPDFSVSGVPEGVELVLEKKNEGDTLARYFFPTVSDYSGVDSTEDVVSFLDSRVLNPNFRFCPYTYMEDVRGGYKRNLEFLDEYNEAYMLGVYNALFSKYCVLERILYWNEEGLANY